jgi:hypothetical protein
MNRIAASKQKTGLRVLITNSFIRNWTGSELYIRDVATELIKRGHIPIVYSPRIGKLAEDFRSRSIPVVDDLDSIGAVPDLIHGQHHLETMTAIMHFPDTPVVFFCHGWQPWEETPPYHPRIIQYVVVSDALHDRLIYECGIPAKKITTILSFVDLERFSPRSPLPSAPKKALIFSNFANGSNFANTIRTSCAINGITVDVIGFGNGNSSHNPETQLGSYDLIFARGRAALEALAIGAAVICCDLEGAGQMITTQNLDHMRRNNFGLRILNRPITTDILSAEIQKYDPLDALKVSQEVRATAGLTKAVDQILDVYNTTLNLWTKKHQPDSLADSQAVSTYLKRLSADIHQFRSQSEQASAEANYFRSQVEQASADAHYFHSQVDLASVELENIKNTQTWRLYSRITRIAVVQSLYLLLVTPIRHWRASKRRLK